MVPGQCGIALWPAHQPHEDGAVLDDEGRHPEDAPLVTACSCARAISSIGPPTVTSANTLSPGDAHAVEHAGHDGGDP